LVDPLKHILANLDGEDKKPGVAAKAAAVVKKVVPTKKV
jgi:hypothetical protein